MKTLTIDRKKRLREEPHTGHNRWHPAVDLKVSNVVDAPNVTVSAFLPEDIFGH